jgi:hypothetical protein
MPQTGPDLVGAGYAISNPLNALLGGATNATTPNVPARTNLSFGLSTLLVGTGLASATALTQTVAVPCLPGDVITKVSYITTAAATASVAGWVAVYTGTGSAPGTTGAQPTLMGNSASATTITATGAGVVSVSLNAPLTVTSVQAPFGFVYVSLGYAGGASAGFAPAQATQASATAQWSTFFTSAPVFLFATQASPTTNAAAATLGTSTGTANPIVCFLQ